MSRGKFENQALPNMSYNVHMYNWSTDEEYLKQFPDKYEKWRLLQLINYGLDGERISLKRLRELWPEIKEEVLDEIKIKYFEKYVFPDEKHPERVSKRNSWTAKPL